MGYSAPGVSPASPWANSAVRNWTARNLSKRGSPCNAGSNSSSFIAVMYACGPLMPITSFSSAFFAKAESGVQARSFLRHLNVECRMLIAEWWGPERRRGREGHHLSRTSLRQLMPSILDGPGDFAHPIRTGRNLVFKLDGRLDIPFVIPQQAQHLPDRRVPLAEREFAQFCEAFISGQLIFLVQQQYEGE